MSIAKHQELINKLMEKFKIDYGNNVTHQSFYLRGLIDALYEVEQQNTESK